MNAANDLPKDDAPGAAYLLATGISTLNVLAEQLTRDAPDDLENAFHGALLLLKQAYAALEA